MFEIAFLQIRQPRIQKPRRMVIQEGIHFKLCGAREVYTHTFSRRTARSVRCGSAECGGGGAGGGVGAMSWLWLGGGGGGGAALPEGLPLLRVWRSTSNLFAVIAVRANTLESSNSLFYFSHHEGDHLSSRPPARLHFQPSQPLASGPLPPAARNMSSHRRVCTQRHKPSMATFFFIFLQVALMHHTFTQPGTA